MLHGPCIRCLSLAHLVTWWLVTFVVIFQDGQLLRFDSKWLDFVRLIWLMRVIRLSNNVLDYPTICISGLSPPACSSVEVWRPKL